MLTTRRDWLKSSAVTAGTIILPQENATQATTNSTVPMDDGACDHLLGLTIPSISMSSTRGGAVNLAKMSADRTIVYCYPRTGEPGRPSPDGWDAIPGARGCTPQSCSMRDNYHAIKSQDAEVFGLSSQISAYQGEAATRLHLPFALLSDDSLRLTHALRLPIFRANGWTLIRRLTMVIRLGRIEKVFYPVFPPDKHGDQVLAWLKDKRADRI